MVPWICFTFLIQHGLGCSDIQMVTRTPGRGKRLIKLFCPLTTYTTTADCILLKYHCFLGENVLFSFGRLGVGHKIPGFQQSSLASHLPHPTARFVLCCPFVSVPATHFLNLFSRNLLTSLQLRQKFVLFPDSHFLWQQKEECCTMVLLSQHQRTNIKATKTTDNRMQWWKMTPTAEIVIERR